MAVAYLGLTSTVSDIENMIAIKIKEFEFMNSNLKL